MAELKPVKVRYAGKCAKCGREIKVGWDAFFDAETKSLYCRPCAKEIENTPEVDSQQLLTEEDIANLPPELQEKLRISGTVKKPTIEELITNLTGDVALISDMVAQGNMQLSSVLSGQAELLKLLKPKEKAT